MQTKSDTIGDFSEQWTAYSEQEGFFASKELLTDVLGPLLNLSELRGQVVAEIGCGNGRYLALLASYAKKAYGIEPSEAYNNAKLALRMPNIEIIQSSVYELPHLEPLDHVFSLGVVHHLPDPVEALKHMRSLLRENGRCTIWVYGREGNQAYVTLLNLLRKLTLRLPHRVLHWFSTLLVFPLSAYARACKRVRLPLHGYMKNVFAPLSFYAKRICIYDQLNPRIAHYWSENEVRSLMLQAGFSNLRLYHRHGYSWTATGNK